mgnify:CR=1 FL=1
MRKGNCLYFQISCAECLVDKKTSFVILVLAWAIHKCHARSRLREDKAI